MRLYNYLYSHVYKYPTLISLNYMWTFGSMLTFLLVLQTLSGIFLSCYYIPQAEFALKSILFLMKEVSGGWFAYRLHVMGSNFIFMVLYAHLFRGVYYNFYCWLYRYSWWSGYLLFLLLMGTAFFGYILPWGQMSYWAATVIINMTTIVPYMGRWLPTFIWGGSVVNSCTLHRMFMLHIIMAFSVLAFALMHISVMHNSSLMVHNASAPQSLGYSSNSKQVTRPLDELNMPLYPLYFIKDFFAILVTSVALCFMMVYYPEYFSNYINWMPANPKVTPSHMTPEWYFLPFYGVVKLIPHKVMGIVAMGLLMVSPLLLPFYGVASLPRYNVPTFWHKFKGTMTSLLTKAF